jgi:hypothetical protein
MKRQKGEARVKIFLVYEMFVDLRKIRRMDKLTLQEEELMQVIWQFGEGSVKTFLQEMPDPKLPYTTVASTIKES